jgi:SSS family solute:Na+ symporter
VHLASVDILLIVIYCGFVLAIGFLLRRQMVGSTEFFLAGRSMPAWVAGLAFLSANLGAQEMIGMAASGAKYGILTSHFYWVGAIPAMAFVGVCMMPFYYGSRARSVPEYLKLRFDEKTRGFNAMTFAVMTVFSSGISMYAMGALLALLLGWNIHASIALSAAVVLVYIALGGLTSAIYNEVLQFFLIVFGFAPVAYLGLRDAGGWSGLAARVPDTFVHSWSYLGRADANPMGVEWFGMVMGLGYPSDMAQNFWGAIVAWTTCFVATAAISLATTPKADGELRGLVFGLTQRTTNRELAWHQRPAVLAGVVLTLTLALNLLFW